MARSARKSRRVERREDALSRERIVEAAVEILDAQGERALTFRALATRLSTGAGALYWHVANKDELLAATVDDVVAGVLHDIATSSQPTDTLRAFALGLFDAIDAHPWVGAHLSSAPGQSAMMRIFERFGVQLQALRVPRRALFSVTSTVVSFVLGVASQNAANARGASSGDRQAFLSAIAAKWAALDPKEHPFMKQMAEDLRTHDDRAQFLEGIDLILAGVGCTGGAKARSR